MQRGASCGPALPRVRSFDPKSGRTLKGLKVPDSLASAGRQLLLSALMGLRGRDEGKLPQLPAALRDRPHGEVSVPMPIGDDAWEEVMRDFSRSLTGGGVYMIGQQRLYPLRGSSNSSTGKVGPEACNEAMRMVSDAIRDEILLQGESLNVAGQPASSTPKVDPVVLHELALQVAAHVSVGPGVEVVMGRGLPPNLWQPLFVICIGDSQVRVLTFAFIGGPVTGDRPDRKRTPFCLRIGTGDLARAAARSAYAHHRTCQARAGRAVTVPAVPRSAGQIVNYVAEAVPDHVQTTLDCIVRLEDEFFRTVEDGQWSFFLRDGKADDQKVALAHAAAAVSGVSLAPPADSGLAAAAAAVSGVPLSIPVMYQEVRASQSASQLQLRLPRFQAKLSPGRFSSPFKTSCSPFGALAASQDTLAFVEGNGGV